MADNAKEESKDRERGLLFLRLSSGIIRALGECLELLVHVLVRVLLHDIVAYEHPINLSYYPGELATCLGKGRPHRGAKKKVAV